MVDISTIALSNSMKILAKSILSRIRASLGYIINDNLSDEFLTVKIGELIDIHMTRKEDGSLVNEYISCKIDNAPLTSWKYKDVGETLERHIELALGNISSAFIPDYIVPSYSNLQNSRNYIIASYNVYMMDKMH
jgi:hypothetical protein